MGSPIRHAREPDVAFLPFHREEIEQSIVDRFVGQVARHPERLAVRVGERSLDYAGLDRQANRIAQAILRLEDARGGPVAVFLAQGIELPAAILGVLKAARPYAPLDPDDSDRRLGEILVDLGDPLVVTTGSLRGRLPGARRVLDLDALDPALEDGAPGLRVPPDALAYVYCTSGSTGRPKGVMDCHRNVLHNVMRYTNSLELAACDRLTLLQRPGFSGAVSSLFGALLNGAAVFPFDLANFGPSRLADLLEHEALTVYHSVPSIFRLIAADGHRFTALRWVRLEGDRAVPRDVELYQKHFPAGCRLVNGLGATECGLVRQRFVDHDEGLSGSVVSVGGPVPDVEVAVVDEAGRAVPPGESGAITVSSRYLSPGYWRRSDLTDAAFRPDPERPGWRVYRSGDRGRLLANGELVLLGRSDSEVKIRGGVVELRDVEAAILRVGRAIRECAVVARERADGETELVAFVTGADASRAPAEDLLHALRAELPSRAVPSRIVALDILPTTPHGKVDLRQLAGTPPSRPPTTASIEFAEPFEAPLYGIWKTLLQRDDFGPDDDFFDLGGDSLRALELLLCLEHEFGRTFAPAVLLEAPTIRLLAPRVQDGGDCVSERAVALRREGTLDPLFIVTGAGASALQLRGLARHLGPEQPCWAFEPIGMEGERTPDASVESLASRYAEEIDRVHPDGAVNLAGSCFGSLVAYEMARQLQSAGRSIGLVAMLGDALLPDWVVAGARAGFDPAHAVRRALYHLRHTPLPDVARSAWTEAGMWVRPTRRRFRSVLDAHNRARARYHPAPFSGRVVYLRLGRGGVPAPSEHRWRRLAMGGFSVRDVPVVSDHWYREPHAALVARALREALREAPTGRRCGTPRLSEREAGPDARAT
jgi:amino acid adenylation domain-containing protein